MSKDRAVFVDLIHLKGHEAVEIAIDGAIIYIDVTIPGDDQVSQSTRRGIQVNANRLPALIALLRKALAKIEAEGEGGRG